MCGICGVVYRERTRSVDEQQLIRMRDALTHRGPDDAGRHIAPGIALGSRRLSILDLSQRGRMPMSTSDGRYLITYNGEVYNYRQLRSQLEKRGHTFRSNGDTEVILRLYADHGPAMLERLNGMFALAIWDSEKRTLFLARDRVGIKPLYYAEQGDALSFASEAKALFAAGIAREFDHETWEELLCFGYVAGERTPFVGIKRLLPGHYLLWRDGHVEMRRWWHLGERAQALRENLPPDPLRWFEETFDDAVASHRISDVPVGVLLSGGLDSGSIAASLASYSGAVDSYTVRFAEPPYDEGPFARAVAERWHLKSHELEISPDEVPSLLQEASRLNDEPLAHGSDLHLLAISRHAKRRVTVLLSGEGGDETLGGYVRYQPLKYPTLLSAARPVLPRLASTFNINGRVRKLSRLLACNSLDQFVLFNTSDVLPEDLKSVGMASTAQFQFRERVLQEAKTLHPKDPMRQAMYMDQHTFLCSILDRNDRMTMGASIECRVPFLDHRLVEGLAALPSAVLIPGRRTKRVLRESIGRRLPQAVLRHRKWGFGVPWTDYLRRVPQLRELVADLHDLTPLRDGPIDRAKLQRAAGEFLQGESRHEALIRQLVMIAVSHQVRLKRSAAVQVLIWMGSVLGRFFELELNTAVL